MKGISVEAMKDETEHTEKWSAVPKEVIGEMTPAPIAGARRRSPDRHLCKTLASPIPAMLAETMGLAREDEASAKTAPEAPRRIVPADRR